MHVIFLLRRAYPTYSMRIFFSFSKRQSGNHTNCFVARWGMAGTVYRFSIIPNEHRVHAQLATINNGNPENNILFILYFFSTCIWLTGSAQTENYTHTHKKRFRWIPKPLFHYSILLIDFTLFFFRNYFS